MIELTAEQANHRDEILLHDIEPSLYAQPWGVYADAGRLRNRIQRLPAGTLIRFDCFNKAEAAAIEGLLTEAERQKVRFTWTFSA